MCWWVSHQQRATIIRGKKDKDGNEDREAVDDSDRMMCSSNGGWGLTPGTHARTYIHTTDTFKQLTKTCKHQTHPRCTADSGN